MDGIYTLGNDRVFDQIVALLNSIEVQLGPDFPVRICPYDDNLDRLQAEVARRPQVEIFADRAAIDRWDGICRAIWDLHPTARDRWAAAGSSGYHRFGTHRRLAAFDGPFDRFLYMDADTLLLGPIDRLLAPLDRDADWVVYDFQYKDPSHVYATDSPALNRVFPPERVEREIFCSGLFATRRGLFPPERVESLLETLRSGDAEALYPLAPDQTILNYLAMRSGLRICNLARTLPKAEVTGCCVTSPHFETRDGQAFDKGVPLLYLHYIGLSSRLFERLCQGENLDFPYRDLFLHYRYRHDPDARPQFSGRAKPHDAPPSLARRLARKVGLA